MENVMIDGQEFAVTDFVHHSNGFREEDIATLHSVGPSMAKKQDIREYCKEHHCWAVKNKEGYVFTINRKHHPKIIEDGSGWEFLPSTAWGRNDPFFYPDVPWDESLIAPNGSMPLMVSKPYYGAMLKKPAVITKSIPHRGDPVFAWDDDMPDTIPAHIEYFHHATAGGFVDFSWSRFGKPEKYWDHYRPFDAALVGVPRKDWPVW